MDDRSERLKNTKKTFNVNDLLFWVKEDTTSQTHVTCNIFETKDPI